MDAGTAPRRLTLVAPSLGPGGAERTLAHLADAWVSRGYEVALVTLDSSSHDHFHVDSRVRRIGLNLMQHAGGRLPAVLGNVRRISALRSSIRTTRPDIVVAFVDKVNVLTLLASVGLKVPVVVSERSVPWLVPVGAPVKLLRRVVYPLAAALVVQSRAVADWFGGFRPRVRTQVIHNPVVPPPRQPPGVREPLVVGVGRLSVEKGYDLLIEAFGRIADEHPEWSLTIAGDGDERGRLEALVRNSAARDRIRLCGVLSDPAPLLGRAGIFALPSRFEGFPNALLEALAGGVPVVATDCPTTVGEILQGGRYGILVPPDDVSALSEGLSRLITDVGARATFEETAPAAVERFSLEAILAEWETLFAAVSSRGGRRV